MSIRSFLLFSFLIATMCIFKFSFPTTKEASFPRLLADFHHNYCSNIVGTSVESSTSPQPQIKRNYENKLKTAIKTSNWLWYGKSLIFTGAICIILVVLSIFVWICYFICFFCKTKFPLLNRLRSHFELMPFQSLELRGVVLLLVFAGIGIAGIGEAGFIHNSDFKSRTQNTICSFVSIYENIMNGTKDKSTSWLGLSHVKDDYINVMIGDLETMNSTFNSTFGIYENFTWIDKGINDLISENTNIYMNFNESQVSSPNPTYPNSSVQSLFITNVIYILLVYNVNILNKYFPRVWGLPL